MSDNLTPTYTPDDTVRPIRTYGDFVDLWRSHVDSLPDKESSEAVVEAMRLTKESLLAYYRTPKGKEAIARSPHHDKYPEEVVDLLMKDVVQMGKCETMKRALKLKHDKNDKNDKKRKNRI